MKYSKQNNYVLLHFERSLYVKKKMCHTKIVKIFEYIKIGIGIKTKGFVAVYTIAMLYIYVYIKRFYAQLYWELVSVSLPVGSRANWHMQHKFANNYLVKLNI